MKAFAERHRLRSLGSQRLGFRGVWVLGVLGFRGFGVLGVLGFRGFRGFGVLWFTVLGFRD